MGTGLGAEAGPNTVAVAPLTVAGPTLPFRSIVCGKLTPTATETLLRIEPKTPSLADGPGPCRHALKPYNSPSIATIRPKAENAAITPWGINVLVRK